ncbi:MAG: tripartite tricarboxylate transporter substrate binding protein [Burkholderiaceae bacterium]
MRNSPLRRLVAPAFAAALMGAAFLAPAGAADGFPQSDKSIRLIIPFSPGGVTDTSGRIIAEGLSKRLGTQVVAENRPGASGNIGTNAVMHAAPDGYTLMLALDGSLVINPHVMKSMAGFNPATSLTPVGNIGNSTIILVAHPSVQANTLKEVIELSKKTPEGLSYGTSGTASIVHIAGELLTQKTGAKLVHVPYKGGAPAVNDVVAGHIPLAFVSAASVQGYLNLGQLKAIAVPTAKRSPFYPKVQTFQENGVADFNVSSWVGLMAPPKTPPAIVEKLNAELNAVLADPGTVERLNGMGIEPLPGTAQDFTAMINANFTLFDGVIKSSGIRLD